MALSIEASWEHLDAGPPVERACFAAIGIQCDGVWLTQAEDAFVKRLRDSTHLSAYKLAEWFAWNWWRHRWEPYSHSREWALAHRMPTIAGGYVWPNITVMPDGERVLLIAKPTASAAAEPLRYLTDFVASVTASHFENAISQFIEQVHGQLRAEGIGNTNLNDVWSEVQMERADRELSKRRQLEALLGFDPDEADAELIERLVIASSDLGESAVQEIAAHSSGGSKVLSVSELTELAKAAGCETSPKDVIRLLRAALPPVGTVSAWKRGAEAAAELRKQEGLGAAAISNKRLASMLAVNDKILGEHVTERTSFPYVLDSSPNRGHVVVRSKWETGRRFELARLLGDRIASGAGGRLFPATRTYTYRQKLQRSFAAELLCPFDAAQDMLGGDYSDERQEDVAEYFNVSPFTVRTMLMNRGLVERFAGDAEAGMAA